MSEGWLVSREADERSRPNRECTASLRLRRHSRSLVKEWGELEEPLNIGHIGWLELTEKGREEARRLDGAGYDPFNE